jgi:hypothetical protein
VRLTSACGLLLLCGWTCRPCQAHADSDAQIEVRINEGRLSGSWQGTLLDLHHAVKLDTDGDGRLTRGEWEERSAVAGLLVLRRLRVVMEGRAVRLHPGEWSLPSTLNGRGAKLAFSAPLPSKVPNLVLEYDGFFDTDPWHRGHVLWTRPDGSKLGVVLNPDRTRWSPDDQSLAPDDRKVDGPAVGWPGLAGAAGVVALIAARAFRQCVGRGAAAG